MPLNQAKILVIYLGALLLLALPIHSADWPSFLGPHGNSTSSETDIRLDWNKYPPKTLWDTELGASFAAPVVHSNRLYVFHRLLNNEVLESREASTGKLLWSVKSPTTYKDTYGYNNGPRSSPLVHNEHIFTIGVEGVISCRKWRNGELVWQRKINEELNIPQNFFGVATAPVIQGNVLLFNAGAPDNKGVIGLDAKTGKQLWSCSDHTASYSTPSTGLINGKSKALFLTRQGLLCIDPLDGTISHTYAFRSRKHESVNAATPVIIGNSVFLSASYNTGSVLLDMGVTPPQEVWRNVRNMQTHWATPIHIDGFLYGVHGRHESEAEIRCISMKDGSVQWQSGVGLGRSSFILVNNHFIVLGERGILALAKAAPDRYTELFRKQYLGYPSWAPPVLSNGLLFLRSETRLLCLDITNK